MNSAMVMATRIIAPLGATAIAANSFAVTAESFCYMPGYGIGSAATTLVGKSVGARKPEMAKRYGNICTAMGALFMGFTGLVMMFICPVVFRILTPFRKRRSSVRLHGTHLEWTKRGLISEPAKTMVRCTSNY